MKYIFRITLTILMLGFNTVFSTAFPQIKSGSKETEKVLLVVTSNDKLGDTGRKTGYYLSEVTHPYFRLTDAGFRVVIASPKGGKAPMDKRSYKLNDDDNKRFLDNPKLAAKLDNTVSLKDINPNEYSAILFAGGHGTMWDFPKNKLTNKIASSIYENGGVVSAVCHGPAALVNIKLSNGKYLIEGKSVTAFTNDEEEAAQLTDIMPFLLETKLIERGAIFKNAGLWQENVVINGRLVTGQNPASARAVGEAIVHILEAKE
jgi:putative intracellular protease/amidase